MKKPALIISILIVILLSACSGSHIPKEDLPQENDASSLFEKEPQTEKLGAFSFGIKSVNDEKQVYTYEGNPLHIPFNVSGVEENSRADFGLIVFVDGLPQPYSILKSNGEQTQEQLMHNFYLKNLEQQEFEIVLTPVTGSKDDRLGIVFATVFNPDFMPKDEKSGGFGIYHSLNATTSQEIYYQTDSPSDNKPLSSKQYMTSAIPQHKLDDFNGVMTSDNANALDERFITELYEQGKDEKIAVCYAEKGAARLTFNIFGGVAATYSTTFYVNHKPVKIMNADYLETKVEKGKFITVNIELPIDSQNELSTVYAITNPIGKDYLAVNDYPRKTPSVLVINRKQETPVNKPATAAFTGESFLGASKESIQECYDHITNKNHTVFSGINYDYANSYFEFLSPGKVSKKVDLEINSYIENIYQFSNGFIIRFAYADEPIKLKKIDESSTETHFPEKIKSRKWVLYDSELNIIKELDFNSLLADVIDNLDIAIAATEDGSKIALAYLNDLYVYEASSDKIVKLFDKSSSDVFFEHIEFTKDKESIVYGGYSLKTPEKSSVVGLIDINSKTMAMSVEDNFDVSRIFISDTKASFCDPQIYPSSGKVPVLDLSNNEVKVIKVDNEESKLAKVTDDGRFLITAKRYSDKAFILRQYSLFSGKAICEKQLDGVYDVYDIYNAGSPLRYALLCRINNEKGDFEVVLYPFECEGE